MVSVIIGTKNRSKLIGRAVRSIIEQTYTNWECIVVDCSSSDNTHEVIGQFEDSRFKYIKLDSDPGRAESLNIGITNSSGSYIAFLDDDDEYLPNKLKDQVLGLKSSSNEVGFSYCWTEFVDDYSKKIISIGKNTISGHVLENTLEKMSLCSFPALMFKRNALLKVNGIIDRVGYPSDWQLVCRLAKIFNVQLIPSINVRVHKNHIYEQMSISKERNLDYYKIVSNWRLDFLNEFEEDYNKFQYKKLVHIYPLITSMMIGGLFSAAFKQYIVAISIKPLTFQPHRRLISGFYNYLKIRA